jgi:hypothetical protein
MMVCVEWFGEVLMEIWVTNLGGKKKCEVFLNWDLVEKKHHVLNLINTNIENGMK